MEKSTFSGSSNVWGNLNERGLFYSHSECSYDEIIRDPELFIRNIIGEVPEYYKVTDVRPIEGKSSFVSSSNDCLFHTDCHPTYPAPLQLLFCVKESDNGGESMFLDSWKMLRDFEKTSPYLYDEMFNKVRVMNVLPKGWLGQTFSMRNGALVFVQPPRASDNIGKVISYWIQKQTPYTFKMSPGDFCICNNHRMMHSRMPFEGERHMLRILVWPKTKLKVNRNYLNKADESYSLLKEQSEHVPDIVKVKLGIKKTSELTNFPSPEKLTEIVYELNQRVHSKSV